jgi:uncharacterized MAPEG superfamily protein
MTVAFWCILAAMLLPYLTIALAKARPDFNNRSPREWEARLEGWRKRAVHAHQNHFEAFAPFAAGVIVAQLALAPQGVVDVLALAFIGSRVAYTAAYLADRHALRSLVWFAGFACTIALFAVGAAAR